ncbi:MAG TPA: 5'/3'-nucleotidase SurE [Nitrospiria bacterium]|nr:5'/3'-nucleotidase SurE [Nitrospiria bacterium]
MGKKAILVTNDDGIHSEGIHVLAEALGEVGEVFVVAPDRERNAASHALTLHKPLRVEEVRENVYAINGTPTDCVNLAVLHLLKRRPSLVVSGINKGGNLGDDVTYSGTVSAAIEGTLLGIPSVAVSQVGEGRYHFASAAEFAARLSRLILERGLDKETLLNVNVPNLPSSEIKGVLFTAQGKRLFEGNAVVEKVDPRGRKYYWIGVAGLDWADRGDSDDKAIRENKISVTPLHLDLTHYKALEHLRDWERDLS